MIALNLDATTPEHIILKDYLEQNASEVLAEKINNGVPITKDGKTLISKKTLDTFWNYAGQEAQKLAEKSARVKAVEHTTVFGWAIHYFEEDSLEGKLYNEDGTEYTPPKPVRPAKPASKTIGYQGTTSAPIAAKPKPMSFFDLMGTGTAMATKEPLELIESGDETDETIEESDEPEDIDISDIEELDPYRSDDTCETETEKVEEILVENGLGIDGIIHDIPKFVDTLDRYLFGEEQSESPAPPTLTQIDETKCVDEDGVVHAIPKAEAPAPKAESAEPKIPDVLIKLFGSTLIWR